MLPRTLKNIRAQWIPTHPDEDRKATPSPPAVPGLLGRLPAEVVGGCILPYLTKKEDRLALAHTDREMWKLVRGEVVHHHLSALHRWLDHIDEAYAQSTYPDTVAAARRTPRPAAWGKAVEAIQYLAGSNLLGKEPFRVFRTLHQTPRLAPEQAREILNTLSHRARQNAAYIPTQRHSPIDDHACVDVYENLASLLKLSHMVFDRWLSMIGASRRRFEHTTIVLPDASLMFFSFTRPSRHLLLDINTVTNEALPPIDLYFPNVIHCLAERRSLSSVPDELLRLPDLRELILRKNALTRWPTHCPNFENLIKLDLSLNQLDHVPQAISTYTSLRDLNMGHNLLVHIPEFIGNLIQLETLKLSDTHITSIPASIFRLKNLKLLDLTHNHLSALPESVAGLAALHTLFLRGNLFMASNLNILSNLPALEVLDVDSEIGPGLAPKLVRKLKTLPQGYKLPRRRSPRFLQNFFKNH